METILINPPSADISDLTRNFRFDVQARRQSTPAIAIRYSGTKFSVAPVSFAKTRSDAMHELGPQHLSWARACRFEEPVRKKANSRHELTNYRTRPGTSSNTSNGPNSTAVAWSLLSPASTPDWTRTV